MSLKTIETHLRDILSITEAIGSGQMGDYSSDALTHVEVIERNARELQSKQVTEIGLGQLSSMSHDLRQLLTGIVGYCALLNSPKLSDHATLSVEQLAAIHTMNEKAREVQWWLDGLVLFASQLTGALERRRPYDAGMLNLGGYLRAQADHYICRRYVTEMTIPDTLPNVYANHTQAKLMLRALFSVILQLEPEPKIRVEAYTVRLHVRARVSVQNMSDKLDRLLTLTDISAVEVSDRVTETLQMPADRLKKNNLLHLSLYTLAESTARQGGRIKLQQDGGNLCFMLTMPTEVPTVTL